MNNKNNELESIILKQNKILENIREELIEQKIQIFKIINKKKNVVI